jgi:hypothetical protein
MSAPRWNFEELGPNEEEQGISEWDQFDKEELGIDMTLLREAIQNSLDARDPTAKGAIKVRLQWLRRDELPEAAWLDELLTPLGPHLEAAGRSPSTTDHAAALVVEDFGTCGLTGRTDDRADTGNYRGFFYRHSSSYKRGPAGGRWGLGKLVFAHMSGWSCWFGLTTRKDDGRTLLMGKAAIGPRELKQKFYRPFPRWAVLEDGREQPVEHAAILARFRRAFRLRRQEGEPGLSVVVPWPKHGPDLEAIRRSVLTEWAVPILLGRLVLEVQDEVFDAPAVKALLPQVFGEDTARFVEAVASGGAPPVVLPPVRAYPEEKLSEELIDPVTLNDLRARHAAGGMMAVRVPVVVYPKRGGSERGHIDLYIARAESPPVALRLRDDITVPGGARLGVHGVHSALVAHAGCVALFLADAEPPAHETWTTTARLKTNWRYAPQTLNLIRTALATLHRLLAAGLDQELPDELLQFFWFEDPAGSGSGRGRARRRPRRTPGAPLTSRRRGPGNWSSVRNPAGSRSRPDRGSPPTSFRVRSE